MEEICKLSEIPVGKRALIAEVDCKENLRNRMYDFGIMNGSVISPIFKSPFGDPVAYLVNNAVIALRNKDSHNIYVTKIQNTD